MCSAASTPREPLSRVLQIGEEKPAKRLIRPGTNELRVRHCGTILGVRPKASNVVDGVVLRPGDELLDEYGRVLARG